MPIKLFKLCNTFGLKKCSLLNQSKKSSSFTFYLERVRTDYLNFLYPFSKDMRHMIFENPKMFVDSYICENYSNEWLMPVILSGLKFLKEWMQNICNHFATTKKGNPLFKRIPTFYRLFHLYNCITYLLYISL